MLKTRLACALVLAGALRILDVEATTDICLGFSIQTLVHPLRLASSPVLTVKLFVSTTTILVVSLPLANAEPGVVEAVTPNLWVPMLPSWFFAFRRSGGGPRNRQS